MVNAERLDLGFKIGKSSLEFKNKFRIVFLVVVVSFREIIIQGPRKHGSPTVLK